MRNNDFGPKQSEIRFESELAQEMIARIGYLISSLNTENSTLTPLLRTMLKDLKEQANTICDRYEKKQLSYPEFKALSNEFIHKTHNKFKNALTAQQELDGFIKIINGNIKFKIENFNKNKDSWYILMTEASEHGINLEENIIKTLLDGLEDKLSTFRSVYENSIAELQSKLDLVINNSALKGEEVLQQAKPIIDQAKEELNGKFQAGLKKLDYALNNNIKLFVRLQSKVEDAIAECILNGANTQYKAKL